MIFTLSIIAVLQGVQITPPERRFVTRDLCEAARIGTVDDLQKRSVLVLSSRRDLQQLKAEIR